MTGAKWSGPYCVAEAADRSPRAWDPLGGDRAPRDAVRFTVRWRVTGFDHPRKRTFADAQEATAWARGIAAAKLLHAARDERGWPLGVLAAPDTISGVAPSASDDAPAEPLPRPVAPSSATEGAGSEPAGSEGEAAAPVDGPTAGPVAAPPVPTGAPATKTGLGPQVADFITRLVAVHLPVWEQQHADEWWTGQLRFVQASLCYQSGDRRVAEQGVTVGDSIHFGLLGPADFDTALMLRRNTNLRHRHQNRQRREAYERRLAAYETKMAAWNAGSGPRGRKPVPPPEPLVVPETSDAQVLVSASAEKAFRTALSFVFDRAFDAGLFPPGPSPYRLWNPRLTGGRHARRRSPFRDVERHTAATRDYPGLGFWIDLGDALADRGRVTAEGVRTGERYRIAPLVAAQVAVRPGEFKLLRAEHFQADVGKVLIQDEDWHLKARDQGETRLAPLSQLVSALVQQHEAAGLCGPDGTLFLSPLGQELDLGNFYEDALRPAIAQLCGDGRLWRTYPALDGAEIYDTRRAGITTWIVQGADTFEASTWSGHTEAELMSSYRGVHQGRGRRTVWKDIDTAVEHALLEDPPRGTGALARHIRQWLGLE